MANDEYGLWDTPPVDQNKPIAQADPNRPGFDTNGYPLDEAGQVQSNTLSTKSPDQNTKSSVVFGGNYPGGQASWSDVVDQGNHQGAYADPYTSWDPSTGKVANSNRSDDLSWMVRGQQGNADAQKTALGQAHDMSIGKGPSLATQLLQQQANKTTANQNAMASSASGGQSAMARRQAMMSNAGTMNELGGAAATARAQEQLGAMGLEGQLAGQGRAQDQALSGQVESGYLGQQSQRLKQFDASTAASLGQQKQNTAGNDSFFNNVKSVAGIFGGMMMSDPSSKTDIHAADLHLSEPAKGDEKSGGEGGAHWIIREEPDFLLAANARTGEMRKIMTQSLSPQEHTQAMKKHGAGPIGSNHPANKYVHDLQLGGADAAGGMGAMGGSNEKEVMPYSSKNDDGGDDYASMHKEISKYVSGDSDTSTSSDSSKSSQGQGQGQGMGGMFGGGGGSMADGHGTTDMMSAGDLVLGGPQQGSQGQQQNQAPAASESEVDRWLAMQGAQGMNRDPNAGYRVGQDRKTNLANNRIPPYKLNNKELLPLMEKAYPGATTDRSLSDYRASVTPDSESRNSPIPTYSSPKDRTMDKGIMYTGGAYKMKGQEGVVQELPEDTITDAPDNDEDEVDDSLEEAPKKQFKKTKDGPTYTGRSSDTIAADLHLDSSTDSTHTGGDTETVGGALRKLSPYTYRYKNSKNQPSAAKAGSRYFGVMSTDLKKDPTTRSMVSQVGGKDMVSVPAATSFNLAGNAHLQKSSDNHEKRLSQLEKAFSGRHLRRNV